MQQEIYTIATIGDSLTEGGGRGTIIGPMVSIPNMYQFWAREWLMNKRVFCEVRNYGSSGQVIGEICGRFNETVPADVIVVMGGTNDVWRCREGAPGIEDEIAQAIVAGYRKVVPEAIDAQDGRRRGRPNRGDRVHSSPWRSGRHAQESASGHRAY